MVEIGDFKKLKAYLEACPSEQMIEQAVTQASYAYGKIPKGSLEEKIACLDNVCKMDSSLPVGTRIRQEIMDIRAHLLEYEQLYTSYFGEEKSRKTYMALLWWRVTRNAYYLEQAVAQSTRQYFEPCILERLDGSVFADCGALDGMTALEFALNCPNYTKIYAYEPDPTAFPLCIETIEQTELERVILRKCAVSKNAGISSFNNDIVLGSSRMDVAGAVTVETTTLDKDIPEKVDFIKMDIEGHEKYALAGARRHISKDKPIMAICVYHLFDDLRTIPALVRQIEPGYTFQLRHYTIGIDETVLYAIPPDSGSRKTDRNCIDTLSPEKQLRCANRLISQYIEERKTLLRASGWLHGQVENYRAESASMLTQITELKTWTDQLQAGKDYLEQQTATQDRAIAELRAWGSQLEEGKAYLEKQAAARDAALASQETTIAELRTWNGQLEEGKAYLEKQVKASEGTIAEQAAVITELRTWTGQLEEGKTYLEGQAVHLQHVADIQATELQEKDALIGEQEARIAQLELEKSKLQFYLGEEIRKPWYKKLISKSSESDYNL